MNYKVSKYIDFIDDINVIFSTLSTSIVRLDDDKYFAFKNNDLSFFTNEELHKLEDMFFVTKTDNELNFYNKESKKMQNKDLLGLTIIPTTCCNAHCFYCYQEGISKKTMTTEVADKIILFILKQKKKYVRITWFGGEPLLNTPIIDKIECDCRANGIKTISTMISNGFLVNKYIDKIVNDWHIKSIQITLDGVGEKYDCVKKISISSAAFDQVINNIKLLIDNKIKVRLRFNFDKNNYLNIIEAIDFIYNKFGLNEYISIYVNNIYGPVSSYHLDDGTNIYLIIYEHLINLGYIKTVKDLRLYFKNYYCFAYNKNHFVINANGDFYKCEHALLNEEQGKIGNVGLDKIDKNNFLFWNRIYFPKEECKSCKYWFLCKGGCKHEHFFANYESDPCIWFKDIIDVLIGYLYNKKHGNN